MKTKANYPEQHRLGRNTKLFRQLFELQIELESQSETGQQYEEEFQAITDSIDRLFHRVIHPDSK